MTINWLHLSDFHIGKERFVQQNICDEIINHVKERVNQEELPLDFIFITGDLANKGRADEFNTFYSEFFNNLVEIANLDFERIIIIPGNHDVNINAVKAVMRYGVFNQIEHFFDPTEEGLSDRKYLLERFAEYIKYDSFSPKVEGKHWLESSQGCSKRQFDNINGHKVGIVGLNTAWLSEGDEPDRNQLTPGVEITLAALKSIKDSDVRIVLGHHPVSWWVNNHTAQEDCKDIKSAFSENNVIYLHGHLHHDEEIYEYGSAQHFLSIGSGACFAARKSEIWKNGLLWGRLEVESKKVFIEPLNFMRNERKKWIFESTAFSHDFKEHEKEYFVFPIPQPIIKLDNPKITTFPTGWRKIDKQFLHEKRGAAHSSGLVDFFDGAIPSWSSVLSNEIPHRPVTQKLVDDFKKAAKINDGICLRVLLGAGGEGKTTILMQTVIELISSDDEWNILWQESVVADEDELNWPEEYFEKLPEGQGKWLIVTDAADTVVKGLRNTLELLKIDEREDIHFLASCRTSDWMTAEANLISWDLLIDNFEKIVLSLKPEEARSILAAWKKHGGLKELDNITTEEAVQRFQAAAISESGHYNDKNHDEGTLLGAMLTLRYGKRLRNHVFSLLQKLDKTIAMHGISLLDAFALIAVPHAENVRILSKTVLAKTLECKRSDLHSKILSKLADEAAILTPAFAGKYQENILTRHRSIAETVREILINEFDYDVEEKIYVPLIQSSIRLFHDETGKIPYLNEWNHLPTRFFNQGEIKLAVRLNEAQQEVEPDNPVHITQLAKLFRDKDMLSEAVQVFRDAPERIQRDRVYYTEWATCEGRLGNYSLCIWLFGISLADILEKKIHNYKVGNLDDKTVGLGLYNLSTFFKTLYLLQDKDATDYFEASGACLHLGLKVKKLDEETKLNVDTDLAFYKENTEKPVFNDELNIINVVEKGIRIAGQKTNMLDLPHWLISTDELHFRDMERYFGFRT